LGLPKARKNKNVLKTVMPVSAASGVSHLRLVPRVFTRPRPVAEVRLASPPYLATSASKKSGRVTME
ncbi:MAG: hypothetical protein WAM63_17870, partial [Rhodomicrobium sp.]